jgi:hypothetical protein
MMVELYQIVTIKCLKIIHVFILLGSTADYMELRVPTKFSSNVTVKSEVVVERETALIKIRVSSIR